MTIAFWTRLTFLGLLLASCEGDFVPKPHGFPVMPLPEPAYQPLEGDYPYEFEYSVYGNVVENDFPEAGKYDINIRYDSISRLAAIHLTYKDLTSDSIDLHTVLDESQLLVDKHHVRASGTGYEDVITKSGIYATLIQIDGEVPNPYQFFAHDSSHHYLRGALYFRTATKNDSLAPLIEYTKKDLLHMLATLRWKE